MIRIAQVERLNDVRPTAFHEHHRLAGDILDHQRLTFMTRNVPLDWTMSICQFFDVAGVDIFQ